MCDLIPLKIVFCIVCELPVHFDEMNYFTILRSIYFEKLMNNASLCKIYLLL